MKVLVNRCGRRLGIPGRPAIILNANEAKPVSDEFIKEMTRNRTIQKRLASGAIALMDESEVNELPTPAAPLPKRRPTPRPRVRRARKTDERKEVKLPNGVTGEGVEIHHKGGGWYEVWVNGFKVTDSNVRKARAKEIAKDFD